ncbi:MAG: hypothetical protein IJ693_04305 [Bacteroidaceae bacterium]|nr:hypothetical protein [Bacteroidaceae bacterium]
MADLFNQEALDALDDHREVEEMARVASPKLKLVLATMITMIVVVTYWCIFGTINHKVTAQGVVFPFGEAAPVNVPYEGTVVRSLVNHGTAVVSGTGIIEIRSALATTSVAAPRDGVVLQTLPPNTDFKAGQPIAWLMPQERQLVGREMLCYVTYNDLRKLKVGQQVQATPADLQRENNGYAYGRVVGIEQYPTTRIEVVQRLKLDPLAAFIQDGQAVYEVRVLLDEKDGNLIWSREKSRRLSVGTGSLCNIQVITERKPVWRVLIGAADNTVESLIGN